jgi:hypothetical protein
MKIKNVNGTYWNEDTNCFGPECAATEYANVFTMPMSIENDDCDRLEIWVGGARDALYYPSYDDEADAVASAVH